MHTYLWHNWNKEGRMTALAVEAETREEASAECYRRLVLNGMDEFNHCGRLAMIDEKPV